MKHTLLELAVLAALFLGTTASHAQQLTGEQARSSPQAGAFLAYENALITGGLDAAKPYMTADKVADLEGMAAAFGEDGFKQFLDRMASGAQGEERRKQIQKVEVNGDRAVLEARDNPNAVTEQHLARTAEGWKVDVKR